MTFLHGSCGMVGVAWCVWGGSMGGSSGWGHGSWAVEIGATAVGGDLCMAANRARRLALLEAGGEPYGTGTAVR